MHDEVTAAIIDRDYGHAASLLERSFADHPSDARLHMLAGRLAGETGDYARELAMMRAAVDLDPLDAEYLALLGRCFLRSQDRDEALACVDRALQCAPLSDLAVDAIAATLAGFGLYRRAADALAIAVSAGSRNAAIHFNLGCNLKFVGDLDGARAAFERAIAIAPQYYRAHAALTSLGAITVQANHLDRIEALIAATSNPNARVHLCHAASKECEALGRYDRSWKFLIDGKSGVRAAIPWRPDDAIPLLDAVPGAVRHAGARSTVTPASPGSAPIFIVGMPRSGTTVLDRVLSNHSEVTSIGEPTYFAHLLKDRLHSTAPQLIDAAIVEAYADPEDISDLGERYSAFARKNAGGAKRALDKFHLNFMLAGHIMRAMPGARVLCMIRNPLDTIVSNFRQLFEFSNPLYAYSLDVAATAEFYIRFRRLAALWGEIAPGQFMTVDYETMVVDPEGQARRVFEFCGLDHEAGCSRIERNTAAVSTASAVQVRQPIHGGTVGNWKHYAPYLDEVRARLAASGFGETGIL